MSAINTGSGSVYPGKELLDFQLESSGKRKVTLSSARGGDLPIWDKTYVDLTRLGTLEANGETIYSTGPGYPKKSGMLRKRQNLYLIPLPKNWIRPL